MKTAEKKNPVAQYFADIWAGIYTTYAGMKITIEYFFGKKVTMRYPEEKPVIPPGHRGVHEYREAKCTGCRACARACPVECIAIDLLGRGRDVMLLQFDIDYARCLFCNLCAEACPFEALVLTEKYNLACGSRADCLRHFARPKSQEEMDEFKALLARKEAERKEAQAKKEAERKAREEAERKAREEAERNAQEKPEQ